MTQEEKARAYDEALERAKKFEEKYGGGYAGYIFPELAESEDERVRKELLFHIQSEIDTYDNMISGDYDSRDKEDKKVHSMLKRAKAYLEKQKEQKPAEVCYSSKGDPDPAGVWKPSEEHLSALLAVFNDPDNIGSQTCQLALTDLYEQLKKL